MDKENQFQRLSKSFVLLSLMTLTTCAIETGKEMEDHFLRLIQWLIHLPATCCHRADALPRASNLFVTADASMHLELLSSRPPITCYFLRFNKAYIDFFLAVYM